MSTVSVVVVFSVMTSSLLRNLGVRLDLPPSPQSQDGNTTSIRLAVVLGASLTPGTCCVLRGVRKEKLSYQ